MGADFEPIGVLGMMSGTSIDGVDAALVETDGEDVLNFGPTGFEPYSEAERHVLRAALGKWPGEALDRAVTVVLDAHARVAARFDTAVVGFHGQTVAHDPEGGRTHQLGNGATLAGRTGCKVVWDFRSDDMKAGGQGAPLAPFFHHALARSVGLKEPVAFLNLGGVANVTWVDPKVARPEEPDALLAFDTGPANALLDDFLSARTERPFDEGGTLAAKGTVDGAVLKRLDRVEYLNKSAPKSLDRDDFAQFLSLVDGCSIEDAAATLTATTAECVGMSLAQMPSIPHRWLVCGGGRKNATMMRMISEAVGLDVEPVEAVGLDGDMLEAQAFAWLAVRVMRGFPTSSPSTTGCAAPVCGGQISEPGKA